MPKIAGSALSKDAASVPKPKLQEALKEEDQFKKKLTGVLLRKSTSTHRQSTPGIVTLQLNDHVYPPERYYEHQ